MPGRRGGRKESSRVCRNKPRLFRSVDFGSTWAPAALTSVKIVPSVLGMTVAGQRILVRTGDSLYLSGDAGFTWKPVSLLLSTATIYDIALSPRQDEPVLLATAQGLFRNEPGSTHWERIAGGLQDGQLRPLFGTG